MKKLILIFILCIGFQSIAQDLKWETDFEKAKKISIKQSKPILVYFTGSDWCSPCKMLKKDFFETPKFKERSKKMVLLMVDMPRRINIITPEQKKKNKEMVRIYNTDGSYPTLVALNGEGDILDELSGYNYSRNTNRHYRFVDSVIKNYF